MTLTKASIFSAVKEQLAYELNCEPGDFSQEENVITPVIEHEKRRRFSDKPSFLRMANFGGNAVISADGKMHAWLKEWVKNKRGFWLFEQHNYFELDRELRGYGYGMMPTHHMFLPLPELREVKTGLRTQWLEREDFSRYYGREEFSNALCAEFLPERPDMLAIAALDGDKIMGMAGCSADTPGLWQIGIDVLPEYRGRGIGTTLVTLLKNETFRRGAIPYYGTRLSNIASMKIALASGFTPAWTETGAIGPDESFWV